MFLAREISSLLGSDPSPESPGLISVPHWRVLPGEDAGLNVCRVMLKLLLTSAKRAVMLRAAFPLGCGGVMLRAAQCSKGGSQDKTWTLLLARWGCRQVM